MRSILALSVFTLIHVFAAQAPAVELQHIGRLIDSTEGPIGSNFAVDRAGNPLYEQSGVGGVNPIYVTRHSGGVRVTVIGSDFAPSVQGPVSMNDAGQVTFQSLSQVDPQLNGSFLLTQTAAGVQRDTLSGIKTGKRESAPSINQSGDVVFLSMETGLTTLHVRSSAGGIIGTLPSLPNSRLSRPVINDSADVAISGDFADGSSGIIVHRAAGAVPLTIRGSNLRVTSSQPQIVENQKAVLACFNDEGIPTGRRQFKLATFDPGAGNYALIDVAELDNDCNGFLNENLAVCAVDGEVLKLFLPNNPSPVFSEGALAYSQLTLASVGDTIDGIAISSLALGDGSMMPDNSVVFHATFANGSSGIYQIVVPEPTTLGVLAASTVLLRRRR